MHGVGGSLYWLAARIWRRGRLSAGEEFGGEALGSLLQPVRLYGGTPHPLAFVLNGVQNAPDGYADERNDLPGVLRLKSRMN